jgi:hypothetical protein
LTVLALKPRFACSGSVKNQSVSKKQYLASGLPFPKVYERQPGSFSSSARFSLNTWNEKVIEDDDKSSTTTG